MTIETLRPTRAQLENLAWRSLWTAIQTGTTVLIAAPLFDWNIEVWQAAAAGVVGGVLSVVKNFASVRLGTQSAS